MKGELYDLAMLENQNLRPWQCYHPLC